MMIDKSNFDQVFFDYFEGNLSVQEKSAVDKFVSENPSYQKDFQSWGNSYVQDENLQFKNVDSLLAKEESAPKYWLRWGLSSVALIFLSILSYAVYMKMEPMNEKENNEEIANKGKGANNKAPIANEINQEVSTQANKTQQLNFSDINASTSVVANATTSKNKTTKTAQSSQSSNASNIAAQGNVNSNSPSFSYSNSNAESIDALSTTSANIDATEVNQYQFNLITLTDKKVSNDDDQLISLSPIEVKNEMEQKGGLELINLGDPFVLYGGVSPIQENPSFAGNTDGIRLKYLLRSEWPELQGTSFLTNTITVDGYVNKLKGGVAVLYTSDVMDNNKINTNSFSFVYSPKIKVGQWSIEPSVRYTLSQRAINWNQLTAGDSFDPRTGTLFASTAFIPENPGVSHIMMNTFGAGILFNGKTIYGGFAMDNLFNPSYNDASFDQKVYIPLKFTAQLGTDIRKNSKSDWTYSPSISYRKQGLYNKLWMSNIVRYKNVIAGASFSTADAMLFSLGYNNNNLRLTYSYGLSGLPFNYSTSNQLFASHQITMRYVIKQQSK